MPNKFVHSIILALLAGQGRAKIIANDIGKLPSLGFNSWNAYGCEINEDVFLKAAQKMVSSGLKTAGYDYVNIDDCWAIKGDRDVNTARIRPDLSKFPDGIEGTAAKVHDMGLKIGIYSSAGVTTCAGYPASLGHETTDAQTFAEWGIDYLKYDNCNSEGAGFRYQGTDTDTCAACTPDYTNYNSWNSAAPGPNGTCTNNNLCPQDYDYSESKTAGRYGAMANALDQVSRPIVLSLCVWGRAKPASGWAAQLGASWRMSGDISPDWPRVVAIVNQASFELNAVKFGAHLDLDMLEIGNSRFTAAEDRSHFALWAGFKSPLILGADLAKVSTSQLAILKNKYLLAFNQDARVQEPVKPYKWGKNADWTFDPSSPAEYYSGASSAGTLVLMFNPSDSTQKKTATFSRIPELRSSSSWNAIDVWSGKSLGCIKKSYTANVVSHDTAAILFTKQC